VFLDFDLGMPWVATAAQPVLFCLVFYFHFSPRPLRSLRLKFSLGIARFVN
jgi:hypothetical protein